MLRVSATGSPLPRWSAGLVACALAVVCAGTRVALAQGVIDMGGMSDEQAKAHFKVGKSLYETGRFAEAAVEWEQAYALSKKQDLLYNLYIAYRDASNWPKAIEALSGYLERGQVDPATRVNLEARLRSMQEANRRAASTPGPESAAAPPSPEQAPAAEMSAPVAPAEAMPPASEPPPEPRQRASFLPYALMIGGGTLIAAGVVTGLVANGKIADIEDRCPQDVCPASYDLASNRHDARVLRVVTIALAGAGLATAAAGGVLLLLGGDHHHGADGADVARVGFACLPGGCAGGVSARF